MTRPSFWSERLVLGRGKEQKRGQGSTGELRENPVSLWSNSTKIGEEEDTRRKQLEVLRSRP
jgi:hypothetical protein